MTGRTLLPALQVAAILAVCAFLLFFGLGAFGLAGADEPRYAQIAREMFERHDWVVPTLNRTPWLEKPALLYWTVMSSYRIFGVHDWAARVPAAAHAVALVLAAFFFTRRYRSGSEASAALMTASSAAIIGFARAVSADMLLAVHFSLAMLAWWAWHRTGAKLWLGVFFAFLGFATLAKGPVAPGLAVLIVGAYAALRREGKILLRSLWWPGFALFFAVTLPWYVALQRRVPEFFRVFFIEHNLERFSTNLYQHSQPVWYYIPVFLLSTLPWTIFTLPALVDACAAETKQLRDGQTASATGTSDRGVSDDRLPLFLLLWTLVPILFFSISRSKLPGYILPAIPPAALLTAEYLHRPKVFSYLQVLVHSIMCAAVAGGISWFLLKQGLPKAAQNGVSVVVGGIVGLAMANYLSRTQAIFRVQMLLHSLICAALAAGALAAPWLLLGEKIPDKQATWIVVISGFVAVAVLLIVRYRGSRSLRLVTLVPVIAGLFFLLHSAVIPENSPYPAHGLILDLTQSAKPVDLQMRRLGVKNGMPVALFNVRRDLAYGLNFYRNQVVTYYDPEPPHDLIHKIPDEEHVVIGKAGSSDAVQAVVSPRQVKALGGFPPQHLEFFLVSSAE